MKIFKYLFFLILIVIIGGAIYVATIDGDYQAEETMIMDVPTAMIFNEVNNFKTWEEWGPWKEEDPNMVFNFPEKTSGEGASYSWVGDESMDGSMKTLKVIPNRSIDQEVVIETPFGKLQSDVYWKFEPVKGKTKVTWGMKGEQSFFDKIHMLTEDSTMSQQVKPMFEKGLTQLKERLTKKMQQYAINVDGITEYGGTFYMYVTTASKNNPKSLERKMEQLSAQVARFMTKNDIERSGNPLMVYNQINEDSGTVIISCGIPTTSKVITPQESDVLNGYIEKTKALKVTLTGNYKYLPEAWDEANSYLAETDFVKNEEIAPFEIYVTDRATVPNPANWETEIYLPIKRKEVSILTTESL